MAIGKNDIDFNIDKLNLTFGNNKILERGQLVKNFSEQVLREYMKNKSINIYIELNTGNKKFTCYTMDLTKKYIEINSDYRS